MTTIALVLAGIAMAVAIDWAIFTHLSAFLRLAFSHTQDLTYRETLHGGLQKVRILIVIASGVMGGWAFENKNPVVWIVALAVFAFAHCITYAEVMKQK